ncbi:MAG: sigma 54-interacting transcriptional regulator [Fibrobacter sp.]|nr:sigma 54-interacting transcriptional regulator [Fibrobacter sp.]
MVDSDKLDNEASWHTRYEKEMDALAEISGILATRFGQREMLQDVLEVLEQKLTMIRGTIMLLSSNETELIIEAVNEDHAVYDTSIRYKWGEGITGKVLETGQPAIIERLSDEPLFHDKIHRRRERNEADVSFICVPVKIGNEVVGTLSVDLPFMSNQVLVDYARILQIVASLIASDVKNRKIAYHKQSELMNENLRLREALGEDFRPPNIIGNSKAMHDVFIRLYHVAGSDTTVIIRGESGTGKELVAAAIHYKSHRRNQPFIKVNCAVLNENLLESELFGHEKGAFTGAVTSRIGRVEAAQGGTLFLDEIGEISPVMQAKLLRVLQEREFERVGSSETIKADVRIIAATNRDLESMVAKGFFRSDLYYRINIFPVMLPPLRERKEDIMVLTNHFLDKFTKKLNRPIRRISTPAINAMIAYHWPGNVRELENCIEYAALLSQDGVIHAYHLPPTLQLPSNNEIKSGGTLKSRVNLMERDMIIDALKHSKGNVTAAAHEIGITPRMVRYKIKKLNIDFEELFEARG